MQALRECYDPEIPVNIVDLGLIYNVSIDKGTVHVKYTLTAKGCPAHEILSQQMKAAVKGVPGVTSAEVEVVWDPPWTPERMSGEGKQRLQAVQEQNSAIDQVFDPSTFKPKKKGHLVKDPDGTMMLINLANLRYRVNDDIANLWEKSEGDRTVDELTSLVAMDLQLSPVEVRPQVIELYQSLVAAGLIEPEKDEHVLPLRS
jgi:metal-sulfur cluster biosynthetic enzyme